MIIFTTDKSDGCFFILTVGQEKSEKCPIQHPRVGSEMLKMLFCFKDTIINQKIANALITEPRN